MNGGDPVDVLASKARELLDDAIRQAKQNDIASARRTMYEVRDCLSAVAFHSEAQRIEDERRRARFRKAGA